MVDLMTDAELRSALAKFDAWAEDRTPFAAPPGMMTTQILAEGTRELLALKENGQTVEWCEQHASQRFDEESCWLRHAVDERLEPPCGFVVGSLHIHREGT